MCYNSALLNSTRLTSSNILVARDFLIFYAACWLFLLNHVGHEWWNNPQYGFGLFVPLFCLGILWKRQHELWEVVSADGTRSTPQKLSTALFFVLAIMIFPAELLRQVSPHLRTLGYLSFLVCGGLTVFALQRLGFVKIPGVVWGVLILFLTAVPWPSVVELNLGQFLMRQVATLTADVLNFFGILAIPRGNLIELKQGVVSISEACSGIRSLQSCLMMGVALSQFLDITNKRAILLVCIAVALAVVGNLIRTLILCYVTAKEGAQGVSTIHDPAGWMILVGVTVVLYGIALAMERKSESSASEVRPQLPWHRLAGFRKVLVVCVVMFGAAHFWFWLRTYLAQPQEDPTFVLRASSDISIASHPVDAATLEVLKPKTGAMFKGESQRWGKFSAYTFFWGPGPDTQVGFFHRPDVCMPSIGWRMIPGSTVLNIPIGGRDTRWHLFEFERDGQKILQAWGVWRDGKEEWVDFSSSWRSLAGQYGQRVNYIWRGQRNANTEIISVLMDARLADQDTLKRLIQELFVLKNEKTLVPRN
jgi:exosortase